MVTTEADDPASVPSDPIAPFLEAVVDGLERALRSLGSSTDRDAIVAQLKLDAGPEGDFAFAAHRAAAGARRPPEEFAAQIAAAFPMSPLLRPAVAKGAYVNVTVEPERLVRATLTLVLARGAEYGNSPRAAVTSCVEHTSANPTGPFHIGRVRNAIIGDTLARLARASGADVTTQYYVDDIGRQMAAVAWIWSKPRSEWPESVRQSVDGLEAEGEKPDTRYGRPYAAVSAYLKEHPDALAEVGALARAAEGGSAPPRVRELAEEILSGMLASLARLGISFDEFVWESDLIKDGSVERAVERLTHAPHAVREENGAWAIDASGYGLPADSAKVIFQRGDGTTLYLTRDVAYHLRKFPRFASVVDVLGREHLLHARSLDALLAEIGEPRRPTYLLYQHINLPEGGRMSTRGGSAVWLDELLAEALARARKEVIARREDLSDADIERIAEAVATSAIRYHIVRVAPDKPVVFRWEDALSFEGRSGPFVQYSYARAASVLRKAGAEHGPYTFDAARLSDPEELALVRVLARFPRSVLVASRSMHVHLLAGYAHDLADQFNRFYHAVPVIRSGTERESRIALVAAVHTTLGNALALLGLTRLETM
jgi:arginyl-tRNA synthetase